MSERYDAVVMGAAPAGEVCAGELADGGIQVAIVERELVAGECSYWACIPSKTLLRPGEAVEAARRAPGAREAVNGRADVAQALAWRDFMVADWDDTGQVGWLDSKGIELARGNGRIDRPSRVSVDGRLLETERVVLATGSDPVIPPIPGIDQVEVWTNREATGAKKPPGSLLVLGGGAVGLEIAQAYTRLGSLVTVIEGEERLLPREGRSASEAILRAFRDEGIEVHLGHFAGRSAHALAMSFSVSTNGVRSRAKGCSSPPAANRGWRVSGSTPSRSRQATPASRSTSGCGPPRGYGRSVT